MESNLTIEEKPFRVGIFATVEQADRAVAGLLGDGFTEHEISVICSDKVKEKHFSRFEHQDPAGAHTPAAAASGGAIGALVGLLSVAAVASTGGLGLFVAGPLLMSGAGAGAIVGGLVGAMSTRGIEKELANYYDQAVVQGKILVAVEAHGKTAAARLATAEKTLAAAGAEPVRLSSG